MLLDARAHVDAKDGLQGTPLMWAANQGRLACVEALIDAGARLNLANVYGRTALHLAACGPYHACVKARDTLSFAVSVECPYAGVAAGQSRGGPC